MGQRDSRHICIIEAILISFQAPQGSNYAAGGRVHRTPLPPALLRPPKVFLFTVLGRNKF